MVPRLDCATCDVTAVIPSPSKLGKRNTLVSWYVPVCLAFYCPWYQKIKLPQQRCKSDDILIKGVLAEQVCNIRILIKVASGSVKIAYVHYGWGQWSDHRWTTLCGTEIGSSHQSVLRSIWMHSGFPKCHLWCVLVLLVLTSWTLSYLLDTDLVRLFSQAEWCVPVFFLHWKKGPYESDFLCSDSKGLTTFHRLAQLQTSTGCRCKSLMLLAANA